MAKLIFTIGHSTRSTKEFIAILKAFDIELLVDIRHYPGSRAFPQFKKANLRRNLARHSIRYKHLVSLGGRRRPDKESSLNDGWRSPQFKGYADYMQTPEFKEGLKELEELAEEQTVAIMCSEAVPWRCHRSLVSDALIAHGFEVVDLFNEKTARVHKMISFAKIREGDVIYPGPAE